MSWVHCSLPEELVHNDSLAYWDRETQRWRLAPREFEGFLLSVFESRQLTVCGYRYSKHAVVATDGGSRVVPFECVTPLPEPSLFAEVINGSEKLSVPGV